MDKNFSDVDIRRHTRILNHLVEIHQNSVGLHPRLNGATLFLKTTDTVGIAKGIIASCFTASFLAFLTFWIYIRWAKLAPPR